MSIIQRGDLVEKLRRSFNILGGGGVQTLSDELVPVVLVDDVTGSNVLSTDYPRDCFGGVQQAATAAQLAINAFNNPLGSGVDCHVDFAVLQVAVSGNVQLRLADHAAWTQQTSFWTDLRVPATPAGRVYRGINPIALGDLVTRFRVSAQQPTVIPLGVILPPHGGATPTYWKDKDLIFQHETLNQSLECTWYWTERRQEGQV